MKNVTQLNLKKGLTKASIRRSLIENEGSYNEEHYKKYWLRIHLNRVFEKNNADMLALHELTVEELNNVINKEGAKVEKVNPEEALKLTSSKVRFLDFEEDKYDYYSITEHSRKMVSWYLGRVAK